MPACPPGPRFRNHVHVSASTAAFSQDIVALSGAHSVGRAHSDRSGTNPKPSTKYTENGPGKKLGGMSWTKDWLKFGNDYFVHLKVR